MTVHALFSDRIIPANIDAEQEVLGVLLSRPKAIVAVSTILRPEHFQSRCMAPFTKQSCPPLRQDKHLSVGSVRQHLGAAGFCPTSAASRSASISPG